MEKERNNEMNNGEMEIYFMWSGYEFFLYT